MLYDDGVIDPRDTRTVLGMCLSAIANAPIRAPPTSASSGCEADEEEETASVSNASWWPTGRDRPAGVCDVPATGVGTVAVYTEPDADAPHVAEADARVQLPGTDGYLNSAALIAAAPPAPTRSIPVTDSFRRTLISLLPCRTQG